MKAGRESGCREIFAIYEGRPVECRPIKARNAGNFKNSPGRLITYIDFSTTKSANLLTCG